jgi:hypothetical protein
MGEGFRVRAKTLVLNLDEVYQLTLVNWRRYCYIEPLSLLNI